MTSRGAMAPFSNSLQMTMDYSNEPSPADKIAEEEFTPSPRGEPPSSEEYYTC